MIVYHNKYTKSISFVSFFKEKSLAFLNIFVYILPAMLGFMRRHMKFFFIFFWLVIISFVLWGVGGFNDSKSDVVLTVGKYRVGVDEYRDAYDRLFDFYKRVYQEKLDEELIKKLDLKRKAIDEIIQKRLLLQDAKRIGLKVGDEEIRDFIMNYPAFQKDGRFNREIYMRILQLNRTTPQGFETMQKENLMVEKIRRLLGDSIVVTDEEVKEYFMERLRSDGKPFKEEEFLKVKGILTGLILQEKREKALVSYVETLKKKTKIIINEKVLS